MDTTASDLANYREQVAAIEQALKDDPGNEELVGVRTELLELISLTEAILLQQSSSSTQVDHAVLKNDPLPPATASAASPATALSSSSASASPANISSSATPPTAAVTTTRMPTSAGATAAAAAAASRPVFEEFLPQHKRLQQAQDRVWSVGDRCRALYEGDAKFYEATILAVGQNGDLFTVEFKGYESSPPSLVRKQDLRSSHEYSHKKRKTESEESGTAGKGSIAAGAAAGGDHTDGAATTKSTAAATAQTGGGVPKKKKVNKAAEEVQEQIQKQNAWKSFAAKGKKTGILTKKSMFASPDSPQGKVGVVGSGKGMTQFHQRGKHVYNADD